MLLRYSTPAWIPPLASRIFLRLSLATLRAPVFHLPNRVDEHSAMVSGEDTVSLVDFLRHFHSFPSTSLPFLLLVIHIPLPLFLSLFYFSFFIFSITAFPPPLLPACIRPPSQPLHRKVAYTPRIYSSVVVEAEGEGAVIASFRRLRTFRHARRSYSVERVFLDRFFRPLSSSQLPPL